MNERSQLLLLLLLLLLILFGGMYAHWLKKNKSGMKLLVSYPEILDSKTIITVTGLYLSSIWNEDIGQKVYLKPLNFRARVTFTAYSEGLAVSFPGAAELVIPYSQLIAIGADNKIHDRAVEENGLVKLVWHRPDLKETISSFFRFDAAESIQIIETISAQLVTK